MSLKEVNEKVSLYYRLFFLKRLLSNVKRSIRLIMDYDPNAKYHFSHIWVDLENAGVKDCYDSGKELDSWIWDKP